MMFSDILAIGALVISAASATPSPVGGICRVGADCQSARQSSIGATLYCKGEPVLWTYNLGDENFPFEFIPTTGCNLILQKKKPTVRDYPRSQNERDISYIFYSAGSSDYCQPSRNLDGISVLCWSQRTTEIDGEQKQIPMGDTYARSR